jgi:alpha/beta superfamily hydrolase
MPADEPSVGVVICCPLQAELLRNYRREVLLARRLARAGIAVQRFHYRGSGHSDGPTSAVTLQRMEEDAHAAAVELEQRSGVGRVAFMGTRWGALVAARVAATRRAPLVMWEPVTDPARYFDEILRFRLMREINEDPSTLVVHDDLIAELRATGSVDVLGHTLERSLYDSAIGSTLLKAAAENPSPALLVQIGVGRSLRNEYKGLVAAMQDVSTDVVVDREAWWISGDRWPVHETHPPTEKLVDVTTSWASSKLGVLESIG